MKNKIARDYRDQAYANHLALLSSEEFQERLEVLKTIARVFSKYGIIWALAFSSNLFLRGIVDDFHDFDLLISSRDVDKLDEALKEIGVKIISTSQKGVFSSPYYKEAELGRVHLDIIVGIEINTFGTTYRYEVKEEELFMVNLDGNIYVPLVPIEANHILYGMMVGWQSRRVYKKELCRYFLIENGLEYPNVLQDALDNFLLPTEPMNLRKEVEELLALQ